MILTKQHTFLRLTPELLGLPNPRTFELNGRKFESVGSLRIEGLDENAIYDMIGIAKKIAHDYIRDALSEGVFAS